MSVGLYVDVHVPSAITRGLLLRGVDLLTAQVDGKTELEDPQLLDRATELGRILFSQEKIFWWKQHAGSEPENHSPAWFMPISWE